METINVPKLEFELHQLVTLHWNGVEHPTRIVEASYRLSAHEWVYQVAAVSNVITEDSFFPGAVLEPR